MHWVFYDHVHANMNDEDRAGITGGVSPSLSGAALSVACLVIESIVSSGCVAWGSQCVTRSSGEAGASAHHNCMRLDSDDHVSGVKWRKRRLCCAHPCTCRAKRRCSPSRSPIPKCFTFIHTFTLPNQALYRRRINSATVYACNFKTAVWMGAIRSCDDRVRKIS